MVFLLVRVCHIEGVVRRVETAVIVSGCVYSVSKRSTNMYLCCRTPRILSRMWMTCMHIALQIYSINVHVDICRYKCVIWWSVSEREWVMCGWDDVARDEFYILNCRQINGNSFAFAIERRRNLIGPTSVRIYNTFNEWICFILRTFDSASIKSPLSLDHTLNWQNQSNI